MGVFFGEVTLETVKEEHLIMTFLMKSEKISKNLS